MPGAHALQLVPPWDYGSAEYRANRITILKGKPMCHWCGQRPATTADHVRPEGGHELENLVPSCWQCNFKRGAQLGGQRPCSPTAPRTRGAYSVRSRAAETRSCAHGWRGRTGRAPQPVHIGHRGPVPNYLPLVENDQLNAVEGIRGES